MEFLLSIIIPTKNRQYYAAKSIEQILQIKSDKIQLVIQDNSDEDKLLSAISQYESDKRLVYNYTSEVLSFVENFNRGLEAAKGVYVCSIGDDDGINTEVIDFLEWAYEHDIDAITPSLRAVYFWPNSLNGIDNGRLDIYDMSDDCYFVNPDKGVKSFLKGGCVDYLSFNLAKFYHGFVKRNIFENVKEKSGYYIGGLSPDIYSSIALSLMCKKLLIIDYPLTISGICSTSGSADSATGKHTGDLNQAPHFRGHDKYEWNNEVPDFYSVETIWADSALAAIRDIFPENLKYYSLMRFVGNTLWRYKSFWRNYCTATRVKYHCNNMFLLYCIFSFGFIVGPFKQKMKRVLFQQFLKKAKSCCFVDNIQSAELLLQQNLKSKGKGLQELLTRFSSI